MLTNKCFKNGLTTEKISVIIISVPLSEQIKHRVTALNTLGNTAQFKAHGLLEYYSVSLPKKSRQGDSLTSIYLYNLTKNLAAQSAHLNYAVLPL